MFIKFVPALTILSISLWAGRPAAAAVPADTAPPVIVSVSPPPGRVDRLTAVTVTFSEPVNGVETDDFLVNGIPPDSIRSTGNSYTFSFAQPFFGTVSITWEDAHGIADLAANPFNAAGPGAAWQYDLVDDLAPVITSLQPPDGATVRSLSEIDVRFDEPVAGVQAASLLINGQPAASVTQQADGTYRFRFSTPPAGTVFVRWSPNHGITDTALVPNSFAGGSWTYVLAGAPEADLVISEFLAANVSPAGLMDEDGELEDWIEIYNRGATTVDLTNWSLSDDPELPGLWTFPDRALSPGEFLVVFASGKDRTPSLGLLHTNFKLGNAGEHLGLYTPDSPRVFKSGFQVYPEQRNDVSYGVDANGTGRYFVTPTPGRLNESSTLEGVCAPVHVNATRGHFNSPFDLFVSCPTPSAVVRYTTNGSEPTTSSPPFPASLRISATTLFRAAAFKANFLPSKTITHSYLFNVPANLRTLPVVSIVTGTNNLYGRTGILGINGGNYNNGPWAANPGALNDYHNPSKHGLAWERPTSVEWIRPDDGSGFQVDCGIRVQGSDYQRPRLTRSSKFSFRLYFRGDYGPGRLEYPLFPLTDVRRFDQIVLRAGFNEQGNPFIRDEIHRRLSHDMGEVASHGTLAIVLINGVYYASSPWYNPCERVHEEFLQEHVGGGDEWDVVGPSFATGAGTRGVIDGNRTDFQSLVSYVRTQPVTRQDIYTNVSRRLDLTNFVDYCILNAYAAMGDWPANNWRAGRDRGTNGIWRFIVWDAEWGMGIYDRTVNINSFTQTGGGPNDSGLGSVGGSEIAQMYDRLRQNPEFRLLWADRVQKHFFNGGALTGANITNRFNELRAQMLPLISNFETEILQWARARQTIFFNQMQPYGLLSSSNAPGFSQFGGRTPVGYSLVITNRAGTIYYTVDGSDPRTAFTGAVSPTAQAYAGPVSLDQSVAVRARSLQGTNWSALTEAAFTVGSLGLPLRITEIMYNPEGGSIHEFLELQNLSAFAVDLSGISLSGVDYRFIEGARLAGGGRLVLGSNTDTNSWKARYPGVTVFGWFGGNLNNGGEQIVLLDRFGNRITSVDYQRGPGWPLEADHGGRSLEIIDPSGDADDPANWQAGPIHGTPGTANTAPLKPAVYLNEVMADNVSVVSNGSDFSDWIELYNSSLAPVNLAGWSVSDNQNPRQFVFPSGTVISPLSYLVVWCDAGTNNTPGIHTGFALDRQGETILLYDQNTNRVDALTFGQQLPNYSIGRVEEKWSLTTPTPGAANSSVLAGSVANLSINEWMANALPGESDWVEIFNRSASPVPVQGIYLGLSNVVQRIQSLSFLASGGYLLLLADGESGTGHLGFKLPAEGGSIVLYDFAGGELQRVSYGRQSEGVSQGRYPDGSATIVNFPGSASPAAANYVPIYSGPILNEVLARHDPLANGTSDFIELYNPGTAAFDLSGMSLSLDKPRAGQWIFPRNSILAPRGYLTMACDPTRPASFVLGDLNLGMEVDGNSGGAYLFNAAEQLVNSVEFGFQILGQSIGLSGGQWRLLGAPTPGSVNSAEAALGPATALRVNEWMSNPRSGADWFEIYNSDTRPIDLSTVSLTDVPSIVGRTLFRPAPLSFVGPKRFAKWVADAHPDEGRNHVSFGLDGDGDSLLIYNVSGTNYTLAHAVGFGAQTSGASRGSLPDGSTTLADFPGSDTPGAPNNSRLEFADTDGDGIPDSVETQFGLNPFDPADGQADADGDGISNAEEYFAGTNLRDAKSYLKLDRITVTGTVNILFQAAPNRTYSIFYTDSIGSPSWKKLADIPARSTVETVTVIDNQGLRAARFYRLAAVAP